MIVGLNAWLLYLKKRSEGDPFFLNELKGKKVLDMGCGEGTNLKKDPKNWVGLDYNKNTVRIAKKRGLNVVYGSVTNVPFGDGEFDAIIANQIIEHLYHEDAYKMLTEIRRLLKPNGIAYISSPLPPGVWNTFTHVKPYPPDAIKKILTYETKENFQRIRGLEMEMILYLGPVIKIGEVILPLSPLMHFPANVLGIWKEGYILRIRKKS